MNQQKLSQPLHMNSSIKHTTKRFNLLVVLILSALQIITCNNVTISSNMHVMSSNDAYINTTKVTVATQNQKTILPQDLFITQSSVQNNTTASNNLIITIPHIDDEEILLSINEHNTTLHQIQKLLLDVTKKIHILEHQVDAAELQLLQQQEQQNTTFDEYHVNKQQKQQQLNQLQNCQEKYEKSNNNLNNQYNNFITIQDTIKSLHQNHNQSKIYNQRIYKLRTLYKNISSTQKEVKECNRQKTSIIERKTDIDDIQKRNIGDSKRHYCNHTKIKEYATYYFQDGSNDSIVMPIYRLIEGATQEKLYYERFYDMFLYKHIINTRNQLNNMISPAIVSYIMITIDLVTNHLPTLVYNKIVLQILSETTNNYFDVSYALVQYFFIYSFAFLLFVLNMILLSIM